MISKRRIYELIASVVMFFFGIAFQYFFELRIKDPVSLGLVIIIVAVTFIISILIELFFSHEYNFQILDAKLNNIINNPRIKAEFVEDRFDFQALDAHSRPLEPQQIILK